MSGIAPWAWAFIVLGVAVRIVLASGAFTADESLMLQSGGAWAIITDPESTANPPLFRLLMNVAQGLPALWWGRALSIASAAGGMAVAYVIGARLGGARCGALVVLIIALHPYFARESASARAYGLWTLAAFGNLLAADTLLRRPSRRAQVGLALSGAAMMHLHYLSAIPLAASGMFLLASRPRVALPALGVAVALTLPLLVLATGEDTRILFSGSDLAGGTHGGTYVQILALPTLALLGVARQDWRALPLAARHLLVTMVISSVGILLAEHAVALRPRYAHFAHASAVPLLAYAIHVRLERPRDAKTYLTLACLALILNALVIVPHYLVHGENRVRHLVRTLPSGASNEVWISPTYLLGVAALYATGDTLASLPPQHCPPGLACFRHAGTTYYGTEAPPEWARGSWLDARQGGGTPPGHCRVTAAYEDARMYRCGEETTETTGPVSVE